MNFSSFLKTCHVLQRQAVREYAFKSDLKIKWVRPEKISCIKPEKSGDLAKLPPMKPDELLLEYRKSRELETADSAVRSLFQLSNNARTHTSRAYRDQMLREVQRHPLDFCSMEARLARMTATIRRYQEHMETFPRDKHMKVKLKELIDKRKKFLKYLRRWDYARFEWVLEKLDLVYKPPPEHFHWVTRKDSLMKLTDKYCEQVREDRLAAYRKELEGQQIGFLEEAIKKMKFVRQEQIDCDVPVTVSTDDIATAEKQLKELKEKREEQDQQDAKTTGIDTSF